MTDLGFGQRGGGEVDGPKYIFLAPIMFAQIHFTISKFRISLAFNIRLPGYIFRGGTYFTSIAEVDIADLRLVKPKPVYKNSLILLL